MDSDHKFYSIVAGCITAGVCTLILAIAGYSSYQSHLVEQGVEHGASAIEMGCALNTIPNSAVGACHGR